MMSNFSLFVPVIVFSMNLLFMGSEGIAKTAPATPVGPPNTEWCNGMYRRADAPDMASMQVKSCADGNATFVVRYELACNPACPDQPGKKQNGNCGAVYHPFDIWYSCDGGNAMDEDPYSIEQLKEPARSVALTVFMRNLKKYDGAIPRDARSEGVKSSFVIRDNHREYEKEKAARQADKSSGHAGRYQDNKPSKVYSGPPVSTGAVVLRFEKINWLRGIIYYSTGSAAPLDQCIDIVETGRCLPIHAKADLQLPKKLEKDSNQVSALTLVRTDLHSENPHSPDLIAEEGELKAAISLIGNQLANRELEVGDDVDSKGFVSCSKNKAGTVIRFSVEGLEITDKEKFIGKVRVYDFRCHLINRYPVRIDNINLKLFKESSVSFQ